MMDFKVEDIKDMNAFVKKFSDYLESENVDADCVFDSRIVCCELISNVLRHCGEAALFNGYLTGEEVIIYVAGENPLGKLPAPTLPDILAESGRGLYIVNELSGGNMRVQGNGIKVIIKRK